MPALTTKLGSVLGIALAFSLVAADAADARRGGGGFGSRGSRTYSPPPPTKTAPQQAAPIDRSMTQRTPEQGAAARPATPANAAAQAPGQRRGGMFGGFGGGLLGGLLAGGLIGALMGHGFGTGAGAFLSMFLQLALILGVVWLAMKLFRRRQQPALAGAAGWSGRTASFEAPDLRSGARPQAGPSYTPTTGPATDIAVTAADKDTFERILIEVQDAYAREDYAALRERTTPEAMSFLAEELSQNATQGLRNEVQGTRLLEADVAEAWREGDREYATAAFRYESTDVMRDRASGALAAGQTEAPSETTEVWTFVRQSGGPWKLSAIQEA
jgi:predicted lipid-binding transport protein (Tim44 family)